jgi:hypothetical protein
LHGRGNQLLRFWTLSLTERDWEESIHHIHLLGKVE